MGELFADFSKLGTDPSPVVRTASKKLCDLIRAIFEALVPQGTFDDTAKRDVKRAKTPMKKDAKAKEDPKAKKPEPKPKDDPKKKPA